MIVIFNAAKSVKQNVCATLADLDLVEMSLGTYNDNRTESRREEICIWSVAVGVVGEALSASQRDHEFLTEREKHGSSPYDNRRIIPIMAQPLNTTIENLPYCVRQLTNQGVLGIYNRSTRSGVCPGTQTSAGNYRCCGINDECLGYGLCYRGYASDGRTGFYVAGCNELNYGDSVACENVCSSESRPDVVWDRSLGVWRCCGADSTGRAACDEPDVYGSKAAFLAPGPDVLMGTSSNETVNGVVMGTAVVTATSVPITTGAASHHGGGGLSGVAIAGISIGIIVPVVLAGVVGFILLQRRKASKRSYGVELTPTQKQHEWHGSASDRDWRQ